MSWVKAFGGSLVAFLVLDGVWLSFIAKDFYRNQLGDLMKDEPDFAAAAVFYAVYVVGIVFLAVRPAVSAGDWRTAAIHGAVLGLLAYGTYDMTNLATLKDWPLPMVVVDIVWGMALTALAATAGYLATRLGA